MLFPLAICCKNDSKKQIVNEEQHVPVLSKKGDSAHGLAEPQEELGSVPRRGPGPK